MPVVLVTDAARADSIAAGVVPRLAAEGYTVVTSDLRDADYPCDLSDPAAPSELTAAFARQAVDGGVVVAFTSDHTTGNLPYGASKGALDRIAISAARELGPAGILANVVNPGPIDTGWRGPLRDAGSRGSRFTRTADSPPLLTDEDGM